MGNRKNHELFNFSSQDLLGVENNFPMRYFDRNVNDVSSTFE